MNRPRPVARLRYDPAACPICRRGTVPDGRRLCSDCVIARMVHPTKPPTPSRLRFLACELAGDRVEVDHPVDWDRAVRVWEDGVQG